MWNELQLAAAEHRHDLKLSGKDIDKRLEAQEDKSMPDELFNLIDLSFLEINQLEELHYLSKKHSKLVNLTQLSVHHNPNLSMVDARLNELIKLKFLDLSFNSISELPDELFLGMSSLVSINLCGNALSKLPTFSTANKSLQRINVSCNKLEHFPGDICSLVTLMELDMSDNKIIEIPSCIGDLSLLKTLQLKNNHLTVVASQLSLCTKLKELNLNENVGIKDNRLRKMTQGPGPTKVSAVLDYLKKQMKAAPSGRDSRQTNRSSETAEGNDTEAILVVKVLSSARDDGEEANKITAYSTCNIDIRPYAFFFVVRGIQWADAFDLKDFIKYQEKLHSTVCDDRKLCTIGTHDSDTIVYPLIYTKMLREEIVIKMLGRTKEETGVQLMKRLYKEADDIRKQKKRNQLSGVHQYLSLLLHETSYPVVLDANKSVISLPPLTNCNETSLSDSSRNILVEVTGKSSSLCRKVCDCIVEWFSDRQKGSPSPESLEVQAVRMLKLQDGSLLNVYPSRADLREQRNLKVQHLEKE